MLILNFNFDEKKFPEIERQFEFSNSLEKFFFENFEENKELLNQIIQQWISIDDPIWFYNTSTGAYQKVKIQVKR
jgi:hypothetical protein